MIMMFRCGTHTPPGPLHSCTGHEVQHTVALVARFLLLLGVLFPHFFELVRGRYLGRDRSLAVIVEHEPLVVATRTGRKSTASKLCPQVHTIATEEAVHMTH